jgi:hypothetical protein
MIFAMKTFVDDSLLENLCEKRVVFLKKTYHLIVHFDFSSGLTLLVANQRQTRQKKRHPSKS